MARSTVPGEQYCKAICLDFDGVLHRYGNGFTPGAAPDDAAVEGAVDFVRSVLRMGFKVYVLSARFDREENLIFVRRWLTQHRFPANAMTLVTMKPKACLYVDDRGWRFEGPDDWKTLINMLEGGDPGTWVHPRDKRE